MEGESNGKVERERIGNARNRKEKEKKGWNKDLVLGKRVGMSGEVRVGK